MVSNEKTVEELRAQWKSLWKERIDDKARALWSLKSSCPLSSGRD
jgi:hypothetical protein